MMKYCRSLMVGPAEVRPTSGRSAWGPAKQNRETYWGCMESTPGAQNVAPAEQESSPGGRPGTLCCNAGTQTYLLAVGGKF